MFQSYPCWLASCLAVLTASKLWFVHSSISPVNNWLLLHKGDVTWWTLCTDLFYTVSGTDVTNAGVLRHLLKRAGDPNGKDCWAIPQNLIWRAIIADIDTVTFNVCHQIWKTFYWPLNNMLTWAITCMLNAYVIHPFSYFKFCGKLFLPSSVKNGSLFKIRILMFQ